MTPEDLDAAAEAESKATAARANEVLRLLDQAGQQIDQRLALSLIYVGVLMARDLDVPESAIAMWVPRLYLSRASVVEPDPIGEA